MPKYKILFCPDCCEEFAMLEKDYDKAKKMTPRNQPIRCKTCWRIKQGKPVDDTDNIRNRKPANRTP